MSLPEITGQYLSTSDPEALEHAIRGSHLEPCRIGSGTSRSELARLFTPDICLDMANLSGRMMFSGVMPKEWYTLIYVVASPEKCRTFSFNVEHHHGYLGMYAPGASLDATTSSGYRNISITVTPERLKRGLKDQGITLPDAYLDHGVGLKLRPGPCRTLTSLTHHLWELIRHEGHPFASEPMRTNAGRSIFDAFLGGMMDGSFMSIPEDETLPNKPRQRLLTARAFLHAHARQPVYLEQLCSVSGLGRRALENLFRQYLGIPPMRYLKHHRLHGVRRELLDSTPAPGLIKRVALEWGFWHLGHFAADYFHLFGEQPSETLRTHGPN